MPGSDGKTAFSNVISLGGALVPICCSCPMFDELLFLFVFNYHNNHFKKYFK